VKAVLPGLILQARQSAVGKTETLAPMRCGFTVSKKVGNAVVRNRVRRRLKAAAEQVLPQMAGNGYDFVIIGRRATLNRPFELLLGDLKGALKKTKTLKSGEDTNTGSSHGEMHG